MLDFMEEIMSASASISPRIPKSK